MTTDDKQSQSAVGSTEGMVDNLVTQFSSALDCFRELVQNSIDAGTPRVDIRMEWEPGEGHQGAIAIHVEDFGEGMDETIIDQELTQLFASGKDEDLTKIGKFGIGFVSVFALEPRAVLVHTGRSGEYWEVLFHEDRSFSKTRVDNPIEGTQITIFLEAEYHRYQELAEEIPKTLRHWCSHSTVEVTFEDRYNNDDFAPPESINEPFEVDGECHQHVEHEGTEIAIAYSEEPIYGFYNRGLTLALTDVGDDVLSKWKRRFEFISFKIKSRYLEHTLARDSVIRDDQYERAMTLLEDAANGALLEALVDELESLAGAERWGVEEYHRYGRLMKFLATEPAGEVMEYVDRPILRCVNASPMTLRDAWTRFHDDDLLLLSHESTSLTERLGEQGMPVIMGQSRHRLGAGVELQSVSRVIVETFAHKTSKTVKGLFWSAKTKIGQFFSGDEKRPTKQQIQRALVAPESIFFPIAVDDKPDPEIEPLLDDALALLYEAGADIRRLTTGVVRANDEAPFVVVAEEIGPVMARPSSNITESGEPLEVAVNRNHPQFDVVTGMYQRDAAMGAYMLARGLLLSEDYMLDADSRLLEASISDIKQQFSQ